jgi:hypothetical protein
MGLIFTVDLYRHAPQLVECSQMAQTKVLITITAYGVLQEQQEPGQRGPTQNIITSRINGNHSENRGSPPSQAKMYL